MAKKTTETVTSSEAVLATSSAVARRPHWAMVGTDVREAMTAEEALVKAELNWEVNTCPLFVGIDDKKVQLTDRVANVRSTDNKVLGIVSSGYVSFQNRQAFAFADEMLEHEVGFDTAFQQRGGRVVGMTMKIPQSFNVLGMDEHELYLMLRTSHDGSKAITGDIITLRIACTNQVQNAGVNALQRWSVNHVSTLEGRIKEAKEALQLVSKYSDEFKKTAERLAAVNLELTEFHALLEHALPKRPKTDEVIASIETLLQESTTIPDEHRRTGWGALNAVTEYFDWGRRTSSAEARMSVSVDSLGATVRNRTAALLLTRS